MLKVGLISLQFNIILHNLTTYYLPLWPTWLLDIFGLLFPDITIELSSIGVEIVSWMPSMADNLGIQLFVLLMSDNEMQSIGHKATFVHIQAKLGQEDGEMSEMTLLSRQRIRNSSPGGLRPSPLRLGHGGSPQYWALRVDGEETFLFLSNRRDRETNPEPLP